MVSPILDRLGELAAEVDAEATGRGATHWRLGTGEARPIGAWALTHGGGGGVQVRRCVDERACECGSPIAHGEVFVTLALPTSTGCVLRDFCLTHSPAQISLEGGE